MPNGVAKVPQVMQMEALECGAACLAMILAYYGRWEPLEKVREQCGVSRDGSKASNILKAACSYGLSAEGASGDTQALRSSATFPCIIFWSFNHFVVLDGFKGDYAYLNDPARGQVRVTMEEFEENFTGVVLLFEKTDAFVEGGEKPSPLRYARERLRGMGPAMAFIMLTAAIASLAGIANTSMGQVFMDRILSGDNPEWLGPLMVCMLLLAAVTGTVSILNALYLVRIRGKIAIVSSSRFMRHLLHLPVGFYSQRMVGDLQQRQSSNETIAFALIGQIAPVIVNVVMLVLYLVVMLRYSLLLTAVGVSTVLLNALIAYYISNKRVNISRSSTANAGKKYSTSNGIDVWICSASHADGVRAAIDAYGLGDCVRGVIGMTQKAENGIYVPAYDWEAGYAWFNAGGGTWEKTDTMVRALTSREGKVQAIENVLVPLYGCGPLAGFMDSSGDFNFCTEFGSMKLVICFNRADRKITEGAGLVGVVAVYQRDSLNYDLAAANAAKDTYYLLQGRDENGKRTLRPSRETVKFGQTEPQLFANADNETLLAYLEGHSLTTAEAFDTFAMYRAADDPANVLGVAYGYLAECDGYHSHDGVDDGKDVLPKAA